MTSHNSLVLVDINAAGKAGEEEKRSDMFGQKQKKPMSLEGSMVHATSQHAEFMPRKSLFTPSNPGNLGIIRPKGETVKVSLIN